MDDKQFQDFLKTIGGLETTATNNDTPIVERGAFNLPKVTINTPEKKSTSLTDSPVGKIPVIKQATQFGVGVGSELGKAGIGLGQTFLKGANVVSNLMGNPKDQYNPIIQKMEEIKTAVFEDPYKKELGTLAGKAGQLTGDIAVFAEGNAPIAKGQQYLSGATKGLNVSNKVINYGLKKISQILPEVVGMGGIQYAVSGGDAKEAGTVGVVSGVLSGITHVGADVFRNIIPQTVKDSVSKVFIPRGKIKLGGTENITDDAVGALQTIKNLAPDIKVTDADGIEKAFIPEQATLLEMPQVLLQAKDKIYKAYSELATKAGDKGAVFGQEDFVSVINNLVKYEGKGYTPAYTAKAKQIQEAINRYALVRKNGLTYFEDTPPSEIQTLIEAINRDVNPLSDKAGAEVSLDISKRLREILDDKISSSTGGEYQKLRDAYGQLKSIEPEIVNEFKKAMRGQGVQSDIIDKIASVDMITGILSGNPVSVARGLSWEAVKVAWRKALGKQANLQRAFKIMGKAEKENSALAQRIYTNPAETEVFKAGEQTVKDIKAIPNKEGGFVANPLAKKEFSDIKTFSNPEKTPLKNSQWSILTAENPMGKALSESENLTRNEQLIAELKKAGYDPIPVEGKYGGNPEHSFLIPNMTDDEALALGKKFEQESVLTPKGLIYQDGTVNPADLTKINFDGNQEDFYSKIILDGKEQKFSIPIDFEKKIKLDVPEKMPAKINKSTENKLIMEAKKFKSVEEFKKSIIEDRGGIGQGVEYSPVKRMVETGINDKPLTDFGFKPDEMVTIYRGVDNASQKTIKDGDYIATSFDLAKSYTDGKVISKEVPASSVRFSSSDGITKDEFKNGFNETHLEGVYNPNPLVRESQLEEIWNMANKKK